ncbi:ComF family protein [Taibaiella koreensis]|uniref:ComF family protein n=1 Tax=Taibaiella koreensis TaxID=1268548 RepID=UPI000E59F5C5|nr:ComF family protein [Taibaiella koreensis]
MKHWVKKGLERLGVLFFPQLCACCNAELNSGEQVLCLSCVLQLPRTAFHHIPENRAFQNFTGRVPIERATSFVYFTKEGMMQHLLHQLKYRNRPDIGRYMGKLMVADLEKAGWLDTIDAIIPVPLHRSKLYQRGYNQATCFAEGIAAAADLPVYDKLLLRKQATATQTRKSRAERIANVQEAFLLKHPEQLAGKHVLLVDDVLTTGATLEACALALKKTSGIQISVATLALAID